MSKNRRINLSLIRDINEIITQGKVGIEKESLRVLNSVISKSKHPKRIGSPLFNSNITTDFSESQLEFITPPTEKNSDCINFLEDIHHFVSHNIDGEYLWPCSIPPHFKSENDIRIADYGTSNVGLFKKYYRNGLSSRYGRFMQAISGVHFNYSLPQEIFNYYPSNNLFDKGETIESIGYFNMLRNILRMNWLILYLFGASPIIGKNFLKTNNNSFKKLDKNTYFLPHATSLRMSKYGYQNVKRASLRISTSSLSTYLSDLEEATNTVSERYKNLEESTTNYDIQINPNILQIEDEYYAIARPKSSLINSQKLSERLKKTGVNYIELRSLDLNPFSRVGIDIETINFVELFLIYCFIKPNNQLKDYEMNLNNDSLASLEGRKSGLMLTKDDKKILLYDWAHEILDEIELLAEQIPNDDSQIAIKKMRERIDNPNKTLSAIMLENISNSNIGFEGFSNKLALSHKNYFLNKDKSKNTNWLIFEKEVKKSNDKQLKVDKSIDEPFDVFLKKKLF
jgi:glutamate--cysteine ligase